VKTNLLDTEADSNKLRRTPHKTILLDATDSSLHGRKVGLVICTADLVFLCDTNRRAVRRDIPQGLTSRITKDLAAGLGPLASFFLRYSSRRCSRILAASSSSSSSSSLPNRSTSSSSSSAAGALAGFRVAATTSGP
jgi:hypothetical protein